MTATIHSYKILQATNEEFQAHFGDSGLFTVKTVYNYLNDTFSITITQNANVFLHDQPLLPKVMLNCYNTISIVEMGGYISISSEYAPTKKDIGGSVLLNFHKDA